MWNSIFRVILFSFVVNSVLGIDTTDLPSQETTFQKFWNDSATVSINGSSSMQTKTAQIQERNDYSIEKNSEVNIFQGNASSMGDITWDKMANFLNAGTRSMGNTIENIKSANVSEDCRKGLERYFESLSKWETWAVQMADSSGKISGGMLEGTLMSMGSFDECIKIRVESHDSGKEEFRGQYCLVEYSSPLLGSIFLKNGSINERYLEKYGQPPEWIEDFITRSNLYLKSMSLILGTCFPSTCSPDDLKHILSLKTSPLGVDVAVKGCQVDKPMEWTKSFTAAVSALCVIALLCTLGTIADIIKRFTSTKEEKLESNSSVVKVLNMFSVYSNTEMLLNPKRGNTFACLDGIRFFSITWVVLSHNYDVWPTFSFLKYRNFLKIGDQFNGFVPLAVIDNAAISLGSFFFISGFLLSYSMWKRLSKNKEQVNFFKFIFHKYWRLTPSLALTITVFVVVVHLGSGPLWPSVMHPKMQNCHDGWWQNFLYINNWWYHDETCLTHTWYVACLLQLHVVGFFLIHLTIRWPIIGIFISLVLFFGSTALIALIVIWKNLPFPLINTQRDLDANMDWTLWLRFRPYNYIHSYAIGMLMGYLILKYKDQKIAHRYQVLAWILSIVGGLYAVYGIYGPGNSLEVVAFWYAFHFIAWCASLSWVTYACIAGYGGIVNRFLSWKAFSLLSTISYLVYLLHKVVVYYTYASLKGLISFGHYEIVCQFLSNLVISYFLAFIGHVTVEMPFTHLERLIF